MQPNQPKTQAAMDTNSVNFKSIVKALQIVVRAETDPQKQPQCKRILDKFVQTQDPAVVRQLDPENQKRLVDARSNLKNYRNAFEKITDQIEAYRQFKIPNGKITEHLINLQDAIEAKDFRSSYMRALSVKKKDFGWPKQLVTDWIKQVEQVRKNEQQKTRQKLIDRNKQIKNQPLPQLNQAVSQTIVNQVAPPKLQEKKPLTKVAGQKSTQKIQGQKPEKKVKKDDGGQKPQKQKKAPKPKKQVEQSQSSENDVVKEAIKKKQEKQGKQKHERRFEQKPKQPKNRVKMFMEYLVTRREFSHLASNQNKLKEMAEFLNSNLEKFMKHHLTNLIQIAKLRNKKHQTLPASGNQFTYFSKDGYASIKPNAHLQVSQDPIKMCKINYKSKLQLYTMLRSREEMLEQTLMKSYAGKKDEQNFKTSDKKLWQYLLRPNQVMQKAQTYVDHEQGTTNRLSIQICHIRYLFQSHKFIRNSWLMMYCYNS